MAIIINSVGADKFTLNGKTFARIYQPLAAGLTDVAIYNTYDTKLQIVSPTHYSEFVVNGNTYSSQDTLIQTLLNVIFTAQGGGGGTDLTNYYNRQEVDGLLGDKLDTDMNNLDNDILEADRKVIREKLGAAYEGFDNDNSGNASGSVGGALNENSGNASASVGGGETVNSGNFSASVGGSGNDNSGNASASVGGGSNENIGMSSGSLAGALNINSGDNSGSVGGFFLENKTFAETSRGQCNLSESNHANSDTTWHDDDLIESVGGGAGLLSRLNLFARYKSGAFYWIKKTLSTITNAVKGFHAADEEGILNYYDGTVWKKYLVEGEEGSGELKAIGVGYGLQHQIDNPTYYGTLGANAINLSISEDVGNFGATGDNSHAEGIGVVAGSFAENARGTYNEIITPNDTEDFYENDVIESVGVGKDSSTRKNAITRWKNGAFKWLVQPLSNITNAVKGFHAADKDGRLNYHDGTEWKKYLIEGEGGGITDTSGTEITFDIGRDYGYDTPISTYTISTVGAKKGNVQYIYFNGTALPVITEVKWLNQSNLYFKGGLNYRIEMEYKDASNIYANLIKI